MARQQQAAVKNQPGTYADIPKGDLQIDHEHYQRNREVTDATIARIADQWSWLDCGTLTVVRRPDGSFWVIDGQGRKLAADRIPRIKTLPCMVFETVDVSGEAQAFYDINVNRVNIQAFHKFKALLTARDPDALAVQERIDAAHYELVVCAAGKRQVGCIALLLTQQRRNPSVAQAAWDVTVEVSHGEAIDHRLYAGLCYLETYLRRSSKGSIEDRDNLRRLVSAGREKLLQVMHDKAAGLRNGGARSWALGLVDVLNHNRRSSSKIPILDILSPNGKE